MTFRPANSARVSKAARLSCIIWMSIGPVTLGSSWAPTLGSVRVASFSLYLAMCDEIDPRYYWEQVKFPRLRDQTLLHADFFREDCPGFRTTEDSHRYHLVVGNVPWGRGTMTALARQWANHWEWPPTKTDIGTLFLPKALALTRRTGRVPV